MSEKIKINYIELQVVSIEEAKLFYGNAFGWTFEDYGADYCAFNDGQMDGGFYTSNQCSKTLNGGVLVVLFSNDLENTQEVITQNGGKIVKEIFSFPGGRRFHFTDPSGNELAVWSDV